MDHTGFLTGNLTLDLAILAWSAAQVLKTLLHWVTNRNLDLRKMIGSGNMPSSHSAFICAASGRSAAGGTPCFPCRRPLPWW